MRKSGRPLLNVAIFILLFSYFCAWAVIKPPFQSPDEFSHAIKAYSVAKNPFITPEPTVSVPQQLMNPLLEARILHQMPFHPAVSISDAEVHFLKSLKWPEVGGEEERAIGMYNYPFLYYQAVFVLGQGGTDLLQLRPYESVFFYRIATASLAALLWILVFRNLPTELPYRGSIFLFLILNPMLAFISSSINVDALLYPLSCLVIIAFYQVGVRPGKGFLALTALGTAGLTKASALIFFPALAIGTGMSFLFRRAWHIRSTLLVGLVALFVVWISFYAWVPRPDNTTFVGTPVQLGVWDYLVGNHYRFLFKSYWGILGWLDYGLSSRYYRILALLLGVNAVLAMVNGRKWLEVGFTWYALLISGLFVAGACAVEFMLLPRYGFVLQGRYFLPAAIGLAVLLVHRWSWIRHLFVVYLAVFNGLLYFETVDRFYDGDWRRVWHALPFTPPAAEFRGGIDFTVAMVPEGPLATRVDGILDVISSEGLQVKLWGWAPIRLDASGVRYRVLTPALPSAVEGRREYRTDVARVLNDNAYRKSGFTMVLTFSDEAAVITAADQLCVLVSTADSPEIVLLKSSNVNCLSLLQADAQQLFSGSQFSSDDVQEGLTWTRTFSSR